MKNKAIFLDRDGTINIDKNYLYKKEEFEYLPGALQGLKNLTDANFLLFIITNQSGIARGFYSEADFLSLTEWMTKDLKSRGIKIEKVYSRPHPNCLDRNGLPGFQPWAAIRLAERSHGR